MLGLLDILAAVLLFLIASSFSLLIHIPLLGALVRFRANYTPKGLQIGEEGGVTPHVGPVVPNYFAMLVRIKRIEGWSGLWKGFMPSLVASNLILLFVIIWMGTTMTAFGSSYTVPVQTTLDVAIYALFLTFLTVPMSVIVNRAITTPHKLPWFAPLRSLQILLTPTEFRKPWKIYLTPGLIPARTLHVLWLVIVQRNLRNLLIPALVAGVTPPGVGADPDADADAGTDVGKSWYRNPLADVNTFALIAYMLFIVLSSLFVVTPLEVITTRLTVQRNNEPGFSTVPQEENPDIEYAGRDEDVIALRPEDNPYEGLRHCGKSILEEEGYHALFRAWWVTVLGGLLTAFS